MAEAVFPTWDVWWNNRRDAFCRGQRVSLLPPLAQYFGRDYAAIRKAHKENDCFGCSMPIQRGDLYARSVDDLFCLNCVTLETGIFGNQPETVEQAQIRIAEEGGILSYLPRAVNN